MKLKKLLTLFGIASGLLLVLSGCSKTENNSSGIKIVTTTNVYSDIAQQVVGKYGKAEAIIKKSTVDPHDFEPTTTDAKKVAVANIVVANGLGYDSWMNNLAKSSDKKPVLVGEKLMGLKKGDNPHIWYNLNMPVKYVDYLVARLSKLDKEHASYFKNNGKKYLAKINKIKKMAKDIDGKDKKPVYVSEPVFDYALNEAGYRIGDKDFEEAIENGTDPSPKMINKMTNAIKHRKIAFFVNNTQSSSSTVDTFVKLAKKHNIPVVNVRETIPDNTSYLTWMRENYQKLVDVSKK
ncbi:zinc ABC transporter substrate-binding protein [Lactobacillus hamsteri]|uniref:Abc transporter solute-binding component n=1 Tax=Lactobacillus hamsteri DSM 5661 = JCM 6256 TaxID=1423754 RepID=A0A0R1Y7Q8_9LACO|nr:zinc ABC transporter substrate-binding protein [Lactobacillus hamsteri]KRM38462.1 abc transporter solute-binding component [Lactobacillus hamsteri DSM 5661 = JCM 6256]